MSQILRDYFYEHLTANARFVDARLEAALALLEKLRCDPSLTLEDHLSSLGSTGLKSHEKYGRLAHQRLELGSLTRTFGRRSSNLRAWGQGLLDALGALGFVDADGEARGHMLDEAQAILSGHMRQILDQEPLQANVQNRTVEATIHGILEQADHRGKSSDVAQYLVGAKLMLRLGAEFPVHAVNRRDRSSRGDQLGRWGDFELDCVVIEVALGLPDEKHIRQIVEVLDSTNKEVWLVTRSERADVWKRELSREVGVNPQRVFVTSVEGFVCQNVTEIGCFNTGRKILQLRELFDIYNREWVDKVGTASIRIAVK